MNWLQIVIFSIVEGLTEFLPVSSTAHLLLAEKMLPAINSSFFAQFCVIIQLAAIVAVIILFWRPVWQNRQTWLKLILAIIPTAILGFLLKDFIDAHLSDASIWTGIMLISFGLLFSFLDWYWTRHEKTVTISNAQLTHAWVEEVNKTPWYKMLGIGLGQSLALLPGVSRSGASIYTARALGFSKVAATALSFIIGVAVIAGAAGVSILRHHDSFFTPLPCPCCRPAPGMMGCCNCAEYERTHPEYQPESRLETTLLTQTVVALVLTFIISLLAAKPLLKFLATKPFWYFGLWRIYVGIVWLYLFWPR